MITKFSYIITFAFCSIHVCGQEKGIISPDSLLTLFKTRSPFDVLLNARVYYLTDFKKAYDNEQLKQYLLKWLNKEEYLEYTIQRDIKQFADSPENIKRAIYAFAGIILALSCLTIFLFFEGLFDYTPKTFLERFLTNALFFTSSGLIISFNLLLLQ